MMRIRWTDLAMEQVRQIREPIWRERLRRRVRLLGRFPRSGRVVVELGREDVREVVVGVFRVAYLIREEEIAIQSVFDARTAFPWPDRVGERVVDYELLVGGLDEQQVDPDHAEAWIPELKRRLAEVDSGSVELMDWDQVRARIEERLLTGR